MTAFTFAGGRKLRLSWTRGPYSDDAEYTAALARVEIEDMEFLQSPETRTHEDFDEKVAEEAPEILEASGGLQELQKRLFPSRPQVPRVYLHQHHDLSL